MSRTFRRKNEMQEYQWVLRDWDWSYNTYGICYGQRKTYDRDSKEAITALVRYHSDAGTHQCREPGPSWFRNLTSQRPHRRSSKEQLRKFILDQEFEVIIEDNPHLEYWT
jgi:hypothetical protein